MCVCVYVCAHCSKEVFLSETIKMSDCHMRNLIQVVYVPTLMSRVSLRFVAFTYKENEIQLSVGRKLPFM